METPPCPRLPEGLAGAAAVSGAERCPAVRRRAMLQESAGPSAVLDRTMFRFHRSTTWLDQAQRKAPRTGQSGQEAASERGQLSGSSVERREPEEAPRSVISTRSGGRGSTSEDRRPHPEPTPGETLEGGKGGRRPNTSTRDVGAERTLPRRMKAAGVRHVTA